MCFLFIKNILNLCFCLLWFVILSNVILSENKIFKEKEKKIFGYFILKVINFMVIKLFINYNIRIFFSKFGKFFY